VEMRDNCARWVEKELCICLSPGQIIDVKYEVAAYLNGLVAIQEPSYNFQFGGFLLGFKEIDVLDLRNPVGTSHNMVLIRGFFKVLWFEPGRLVESAVACITPTDTICNTRNRWEVVIRNDVTTQNLDLCQRVLCRILHVCTSHSGVICLISEVVKTLDNTFRSFQSDRSIIITARNPLTINYFPVQQREEDRGVCGVADINSRAPSQLSCASTRSEAESGVSAPSATPNPNIRSQTMMPEDSQEYMDAQESVDEKETVDAQESVDGKETLDERESDDEKETLDQQESDDEKETVDAQESADAQEPTGAHDLVAATKEPETKVEHELGSEQEQHNATETSQVNKRKKKKDRNRNRKKRRKEEENEENSIQGLSQFNE